jgi:hypothetical protein
MDIETDAVPTDDARDRPSASAATGDSVDLLLRYVHDRDEHCPACGYNIRGLVKPVCSECGERLHLRVGRERLDLRWLLVALAPSMFSIVPTALLLLAWMNFGLPSEWEPYALGVIGAASTAFGGVLFARRRRFLDARPAFQVRVAITTWCLHIGAFITYVTMAS